MPTMITGGAGFIGAHVLKRLLTRGEPLVAYDQMPDTALLEAVLGPKLSRVTTVRGDVLDLPFLVRTAQEHRIDKVVHLAYVLGSQTERNPALTTKVNVEGTNNVFEMAGFLGIRRVVWASSVAVFGPRSRGPDGTIGSDSPFDPQTVYGACKLTNELVARRYAHIYGLEPVGLRFPVVYGPEVRRGWAAFIPNLVERLARGESNPPAPRDDQVVNWGYVEDIAGSVVRALEVPPPPRRVYTVAGYEATVGEIVSMVLDMFPGAGAVPLEGYPMVRLETRFDLSEIKTDLDWEPEVTAEEGVRRIVEHYGQR